MEGRFDELGDSLQHRVEEVREEVGQFGPGVEEPKLRVGRTGCGGGEERSYAPLGEELGLVGKRGPCVAIWRPLGQLGQPSLKTDHASRGDREGYASKMTVDEHGKLGTEVGVNCGCRAMWRQGVGLGLGGSPWQGFWLCRSEARTQRTRFLWVC